MSKTEQLAIAINNEIKSGKSITQIKVERSIDNADWQRCSAKAYALNLKAERAKRLKDEIKPHVSTTSSTDVIRIIELNERLANFAILLPITTTTPEMKYAVKLADLLPASEAQLLDLIERTTMQPYFRALQRKGRFQTFQYFKPVANLIDAATLSYYRRNYMSCYMTLVPIIEGILFRWLGFDGSNYEPDFDNLRRFFKNGYQRQPMPWNIEFHEIFCNVCNELLKMHFFKPTGSGGAHNLFNRHLAAHLLDDGQFATKANCLRLFMLLDAMTEIYFYESRGEDPRVSLHRSQTDPDALLFASVQTIGKTHSPEDSMLNI